MTHLTVHHYDLALSAPFRIAYDTVTHSRNLLVSAQRDGITGYGEAGPVPTITGEDQETTLRGLTAWLRSGGPTMEGVVPIDQLGIAGGLAANTALLDLAAREDGDPLCTFLSGARPRPIATSITVPLMTPDEAAPYAAVRRAAGFTIFKVKAGAGVDEDLERVRRVREAVGGCEIRVDANQGWSRAEAAHALPGLRDLGVDVLEQPLDRSDLDGHAALRGQGVPIMLDESVFGAADARRAIAAGACDRINIKLQKAGSPREALAIAQAAADADVPCMLGCMIESRVGILAAAHVVAAHDNIVWADLDGHTFLATEPVTGGPTIMDGVIRLDGSPGLGISAVAAGDVAAASASPDATAPDSL
jgi:L-Ala-D/L-Glu epimerase